MNMISRWYELKPAALLLREKGHSLRFIETNLGIPRSTLSGWFRDISLSEAQESTLAENRLIGLSKAREVIAARREHTKHARLAEAKQSAEKTLSSLQLTTETLDLALAMLYWGKGNKTQATTLGAADTSILQFFLAVLKRNYGVKTDEITCELHLRRDHIEQDEITYWAHSLGVSPTQFRRVYFDRKAHSVAQDRYHGVCLIHCSNVAIQHKLVYLYKSFCEKVIDMGD